MATKISTWSIRLMGPEMSAYPSAKVFDDANQGVFDEVNANVSKCEDVLNEHCPEGFYVKIEE